MKDSIVKLAPRPQLQKLSKYPQLRTSRDHSTLTFRVLNIGKNCHDFNFQFSNLAFASLTGGGTMVIDGFIIELFQNEIVKQNMSHRVKTIVT